MVPAPRLEPRRRVHCMAPPEGGRDDGETVARRFVPAAMVARCRAPGAWDAAAVADDEEIIGRLHMSGSAFGLAILGQPLLTQFLGPWIKPGSGRTRTRIEHGYEILRGLIAGIARA